VFGRLTVRKGRNFREFGPPTPRPLGGSDAHGRAALVGIASTAKYRGHRYIVGIGTVRDRDLDVRRTLREFARVQLDHVERASGRGRLEARGRNWRPQSQHVHVGAFRLPYVERNRRRVVARRVGARIDL
jgi:hypothetical protein